MKIVLEHISKRYPNRDKKVGGVFTAVDDFDLTIPDGKLVGLLGPSGCGKSTTLNMICGLETPTEGKIWFGDTDVTSLTPELRGVGMVFQSYALYPHLTVRQNIMFPLENLKGAEKLPKDEMLRRVEEAAGLVQISELLDRKPNEMSGGQQQRVAIARALVKMPKVLLLDEPLSNLDARLRLSTREEIRRIQRETGITTIFVTHDQEEAMSICDEIVVMEAGIIRQVGRPQDVYDEPDNLFVSKFLGTPPINVFDAEVRDGQLLIGDAAMFDVPDLPDGPVVAGVRPEGFVVDSQGPLVCGLDMVERMGRDKSVVATHPKLTSARQIRAIIDSDVHVNSHTDTVRFRLRRAKTRLFDAQTGTRIHFAHDEVVREYNRQTEA
jgi:multiple sugar transport system ATP-binding protein